MTWALCYKIKLQSSPLPLVFREGYLGAAFCMGLGRFDMLVAMTDACYALLDICDKRQP